MRNLKCYNNGGSWRELGFQLVTSPFLKKKKKKKILLIILDYIYSEYS